MLFKTYILSRVLYKYFSFLLHYCDPLLFVLSIIISDSKVMLIFNAGIMIWWIFMEIKDDYHKFNGDCISDEFVKKLFRKGKANVCFSAVPYSVPIC